MASLKSFISPPDNESRGEKRMVLKNLEGEDLFIITSYYPPPFQAASNRIVSLANYLLTKYPGASIGFLVLGRDSPISGTGEGWEVSFHSCGFRPTPLNPLFLLWAIWVCVREIGARSPRHVMVTAPPANTLIAGIIASRLLHVPNIIDLQDDWEGVYLDSFPHGGAARWVYRFVLALYGMLARSVYDSAIYMLTADETLGKIARNQYSGRIAPVLNGVEMEDLAMTGESSLPANEVPQLVYSGELSWRPGVIHIVAPHLGKPEHGGWQINIIGGGTEESVERLKSLFNGGTARFLGSLPRAEALRLIMGSDAALLAMTEGSQLDHLLPVKLMDYLSCGTPVLAVIPPDSFAARKIEELSAGIVVSSLDPGGIPGALSELRSHEWRKRTRKTGQMAASLLSSSKQWRRFVNSIPSIVDGNR